MSGKGLVGFKNFSRAMRLRVLALLEFGTSDRFNIAYLDRANWS